MSTALFIPIALLAGAALCDARWRLIPNAAPVAMALSGLAWGVATLEPVALLQVMALALAVFAGGAALFALGAMGGGDVKLAAALALWLTPGQLVAFLILTSLAGAALALGYAAWRIALDLRAGAPGRAAARAALTAPVPYGVAIAASGALVLTAGG